MKIIVESIKYQDEKFIFDFKNDEFNNIIYLEEECEINNNIYYFGYKFNNGINGLIKSEFLKQLKYRDLSTIKNSDYETFIKKSVHQLDKKINLARVDLIIYPQTKSPLVSDILRYIYGFTAPTIKNIELVKNAIENIDYDNKIIKSIQSDFKILIIDDINTSGTTIKELLRNINFLNPNNEKIVFTLLGK